MTFSCSRLDLNEILMEGGTFNSLLCRCRLRVKNCENSKDIAVSASTNACLHFHRKHTKASWTVSSAYIPGSFYKVSVRKADNQIFSYGLTNLLTIAS